eukprot:2086914-Alexandrium_andersonii.AAC.1
MRRAPGWEPHWKGGCAAAGQAPQRWSGRQPQPPACPYEQWRAGWRRPVHPSWAGGRRRGQTPH